MLHFLFKLALIAKLALANSDLLSLVVLFRHGDRTPIQPYPNDPYKNSSYWPVDFGQLTNIGKEQHFELGKWLRSRYDDFLPVAYGPKSIYVRSSDVDRTLMSAAANLAGLYPPENSQIWDPNLAWQPIPIHTVPEGLDTIISMKKSCPAYNHLLQKLFQTPFFQNITHQNHDLYAYLSRNSGELVNSIISLEYLYNTLQIETWYNYTLPEWTQAVYPDKLKPWADFGFAISAYTPALARLKTGTFFNEVLTHFRNDTRKLAMFSGHDNNIANVLNAMGAFEYHSPPYASTVLFELRRRNGSDFVNVYYKNSSKVQEITMKGCAFDCDLETFVALLEPITITTDQWEVECHPSWYQFTYMRDLRLLMLFAGFSGVVSLLVCVLLAIRCYQNLKKENATLYMKLPIEEIG